MRSNITAKKVIIRLLIGFIAGMAIGAIIPLILTGGRSLASQKIIDLMGGSVVAASMIDVFLAGILGTVSFGGTLFYEIESWNIAKATSLHLVIILIAYLSIGLFLEWLPLDIKWILIMSLIMTALFFTIWVIMYLTEKKKTEELNEFQKKYNKQNKE